MSDTWMTADLMPDGCSDDRCRGVAYFPFRWDHGNAFYECERNHIWGRKWGHSSTGEAYENVGVPR